VAYQPPRPDRGVLAISHNETAPAGFASVQTLTGTLQATGCSGAGCAVPCPSDQSGACGPETAGQAEVFSFTGNGQWVHAMPSSGRDWTRFQDLSLRVAGRALSPEGMPAPGPAMTARVTDGSGHDAVLVQDPGFRGGPVHSRAGPLDIGTFPITTLTDLVFDLEPARDQGVDLSDVRSVTFSIDAPLLVADVMLRA
jgi:hypothetical protein